MASGMPGGSMCSVSSPIVNFAFPMSTKTWCEQEREIGVYRPALPRERESAGRERWLDAAELSQLEAALPRSWWPLFATLAYTGLRVGEAQGLSWSDIRLSDQVITVHDRG